MLVLQLSGRVIYFDVSSYRLWRHQLNVNRATDARFIVISGFIMSCKQCMYCRENFHVHWSVILVLNNLGDKHQNNTPVSAWTVRHSIPYIILCTRYTSRNLNTEANIMWLTSPKTGHPSPMAQICLKEIIDVLIQILPHLIPYELNVNRVLPVSVLIGITDAFHAKCAKECMGTRGPTQNVDNIVKCSLLKLNFENLIQISLKFRPKGSLDNKSALVEVIACRRSSDQLLSGPQWSKIGAYQWRHYGRGGVLNHRRFDFLLKRLYRRRSKKTSKLRVRTKARDVENLSIWWRHHCFYGSPDLSGSEMDNDNRVIPNVWLWVLFFEIQYSNIRKDHKGY